MFKSGVSNLRPAGRMHPMVNVDAALTSILKPNNILIEREKNYRTTKKKKTLKCRPIAYIRVANVLKN